MRLIKNIPTWYPFIILIAIIKYFSHHNANPYLHHIPILCYPKKSQPTKSLIIKSTHHTHISCIKKSSLILNSSFIKFSCNKTCQHGQWYELNTKKRKIVSKNKKKKILFFYFLFKRYYLFFVSSFTYYSFSSSSSASSSHPWSSHSSPYWLYVVHINGVGRMFHKLLLFTFFFSTVKYVCRE